MHPSHAGHLPRDRNVESLDLRAASYTIFYTRHMFQEVAEWCIYLLVDCPSLIIVNYETACVSSDLFDFFIILLRYNINYS